MPTRRLHRHLLHGVVALAVVCVPLAGATVERVAAAPAQSSPAAADVGHRRSDLRLDLVSRSFASGTWTIVVDARVNSNNVCVPFVFDCIVGALDIPAGAHLVDLQCRSLLWNHLLLFRDHCLKQVFTAGHDQKFRFTYTTTQQSGTVTLGAEFGRGVLPYLFQQLASATVTVNLDDPLTVSKTCADTDGTDDATFGPGAPIVCTVVVDYPTPATGPGASVTAATVTDTADPAVFASGALTFTSTTDPSPQTWSCPSSCSLATGQIDSGTSTTFTFTGTAVSTPTGGSGTNAVDLAWTAPSSGSADASADVTVTGTGDTDLTITKAATGASVPVGQPLSWTVTVTNPGNGASLAATDVTVLDTASLQVAGVNVAIQGVTMEFTSGVGTWNCSGPSCTAATMGVGTATFTATTVADQAGTIVNESSVDWSNDILGPDNPQVAGAVATADPVVTPTVPTTTVPTSTPARLAFTG